MEKQLYRCLSRHQKTFTYCVSKYDKNSSYTITFNVYEVLEWVLQYRNILIEFDMQLFEKLTTGLIKEEGKNMHGKLKCGKNVSSQIFMVKTFHVTCIVM